MNLDPNQPDPHDVEPDDGLPDEALLADALRHEPTPEALAELEAKVLALTDPRMTSLLDEALAPETAPDQLAERIIAATMPGAIAQEAGANAEPAVIARIGFSTWRYAAAAVLAGAATVGIWVLTQQGNTDTAVPDEQLAVQDETDASMNWDNTEYAEVSDTYFAEATLPVETTLQTVSEDFDRFTSDSGSIWSDIDSYEQFLTELETAQDNPAT